MAEAVRARRAGASRVRAGSTLFKPQRSLRCSACKAWARASDTPLEGTGLGTRAVHGGPVPDDSSEGYSDTINTPLVQTATYTFTSTEELVRYQEGSHPSFEYGRYGNYTTLAAERAICSLEDADDCLISSSGMNTATTMLLALCQPGSHLVTTTDCYRRTRQFIQSMLPKMGVSYDVVQPGDYESLTDAINPNTSIFFTESPTNPYLRCVDIERARSISDQQSNCNCAVVIDSTFATPVNQLPLTLGAHLVVHSASKYLAGHHDVLAGALAGSTELVQAVRELHAVLGGVADPHAAWLLIRGMKTLPLRVRQSNSSAQRIAETLSSHPLVTRVHYPGLNSHSDHQVAMKQMTGFGGVLSFEVDGNLWDTAAVVDNVKLPYIAPSLGGTESLIEQPAVISYWDQSEAGRAKLGIRDNLIRLALGIEDAEDLERDLLNALDAAAAHKRKRVAADGASARTRDAEANDKPPATSSAASPVETIGNGKGKAVDETSSSPAVARDARASARGVSKISRIGHASRRRPRSRRGYAWRR